MVERKILVVDDEAQIREVLEMAFNKAGYTVRSAAGAEEAFNIIARRITSYNVCYTKLLRIRPR